MKPVGQAPSYQAPAVLSPAQEEDGQKELPNTGESSSVTMLVLGAILGAFGLVTVRRKN